MIKDLKIVQSATGYLGAARIWGVTHAPTILMGVGIVSQVAALISACVQTVNMPDIIEDRDQDLDSLRLDWIDKRMTDKDYRRAVGSRYISFGLQVGRNYLVPLALEVFGIACTIKGHNMVLTECAALGTLLMEATERENRLEDAVRNEFGEEVLTRLKRGEPVGEITHVSSDGTVRKEVIYEELEDFDFIWDRGMRDFCPNDNNMNHTMVGIIEGWGRNSQQLYGGLCRINDIYRRFGAFDKIRSENDEVELGFPSMLIDGWKDEYELKLVAEEEPLPFNREDGSAPPLRIKFVHKPIACKELYKAQGLQQS